MPTIRCREYSLAYIHVVTPLSSTPLDPLSRVTASVMKQHKCWLT